MNPSTRTRLRLILRDLSGGMAFLSIVLSGALPQWAMVTFAVAWGVSLLGFRPFSGRWERAASVVLAIALVGFFFSLRFLDPIIAACAFAGLVTCHRMLAAPTPGTDSQVHLASLLMLAGGAALSGEIYFGACLILFGLLACASLGMTVLEGPTPRGEVVDIKPAMRRLMLGVMFAGLGGIAFFVLFPRLSWNIASRRSPPGFAATTGMSDRVRLEGGGTIKRSPRVVARVKLTPDPGTSKLDHYWVGRHFDRFDLKEWRSTGADGKPVTELSLRAGGPRSVTQSIELLPSYDSKTLIALENPVAFSSLQVLGTSSTSRGTFIEVSGDEVRASDQGNGVTYRAISAPAEDLTLRERDEPPGEQYLGLPKRLDPRVAELAKSVAGSSGDPKVIAQRLTTHLNRNFGYTLDLGDSSEDPLAQFLFERKQGHCEHFATALAVMLRSQKVPARVVSGFYGAERFGTEYLVRAGDAHAWVEAWIPEVGWRSFDATPAAGRENQPSPVLGWLMARYDDLDTFWRRRVVDYSIQDQFEMARALVRPPRPSAPQSALSRLPGPKVFVAAAAAFLIVYALFMRLSRPASQRPHPAATFLKALEKSLADNHIERPAGELVEETSRRLRTTHHPLSAAVARATRRYLEARFGSRPMDEAEAKALLAPLKPA